MDTVGLVASILLGALFLLAGASKIAMGEAWPIQARDLGAPALLIPVVPYLELVVGALLVVQVARTVVASAAIVLLVAFTVLIVVQLSRGRRPPCACFGGWSSKPIGPSHVVRNLAMIALGIVAIAA